MRSTLLLLLLCFAGAAAAQSLPSLKPELYSPRTLTAAERDSIKVRAKLYASILNKQEADKPLTDHEKTFLEQVELLSEEASLDYYLNEGDYYYIGSYGCSYYENGGPDTAWASSTLNETYHVSNIADETLDRAWSEGKPGSGMGETITFRMVPNAWPMENIIIYNGYQKDIGLWKRNNRVKSMKLYVDGTPVAILELDDEVGGQSFDVKKWFKQREKPYVIKLEILAVYKGEKHDDTVISEIVFDGPSMH